MEFSPGDRFKTDYDTYEIIRTERDPVTLEKTIIFKRDGLFPMPEMQMKEVDFIDWVWREADLLLDDKAPQITLIGRHDYHEVVDNTVLYKTFKYCRDCKREVI